MSGSSLLFYPLAPANPLTACFCLSRSWNSRWVLRKRFLFGVMKNSNVAQSNDASAKIIAVPAKSLLESGNVSEAHEAFSIILKVRAHIMPNTTRARCVRAMGDTSSRGVKIFAHDNSAIF